MIVADARRLPFADSTFQMSVTSPPYWGKRDYGDDRRELGRDGLSLYLAAAAWLSEIRRVLDDAGVLWLNAGDTYAGSGGAGGDYNAGGTKDGERRYRQGDSGLPRLNLCLVPETLAQVAQSVGFIVRSRVTWDKGQLERQDVEHVRRPLSASETIWMLAKSTTHRFYTRRTAEQRGLEVGDVWHFPPVRGRRRGPAPFPDELPSRCIAHTSRPGDLVLDPFVGSGTTVRVANEMSRRGVGIDLYLNGD